MAYQQPGVGPQHPYGTFNQPHAAPSAPPQQGSFNQPHAAPGAPPQAAHGSPATSFQMPQGDPAVRAAQGMTAATTSTSSWQHQNPSATPMIRDQWGNPMAPYYNQVHYTPYGRDDWLYDVLANDSSAPLVAKELQAKMDKDAQDAETKGATTYSGIGVTGFCFNSFNDIAMMWRHLARSFEQETLLNDFIASPAEKQYLEKAGVELPNLMNFLVWRRSAMKMSLLLGILMLSHSLPSGVQNILDKLDGWDQQNLVVDFDLFKEKANELGRPEPSFMDFSLAVALDIQRVISLKSGIILAIQTIVHSMFHLVAVVCTVMAIVNWPYFGRSRKFMLWAWLFTILPPFLTSMVPARSFVQWDDAGGMVREFRHELGDFVGAGDRFDQLRESCDKIQNEGDEMLAKEDLHINKVCEFVDHRAPKKPLKVPCSWNIFKWCKVDFTPAHEGCAKVREAFATGKFDKAMKKAQKVCKNLDETLSQFKGLKDGDVDQFLDDSAHQVQRVAEKITTFILALDGFRRMMPAALTIPNGLLKGALRVKLLVPQSSTPGMLVTILPWLFCPLNWCLYSLFFQLIGRTSLFLGLFALAFSPMVNLFVGRYYNVDKPMSDEKMIQVFDRLSTCNNLVTLCSMGMLGWFAGTMFQEQWNKGHVQLMWQHYLDGGGSSSGLCYTMGVEGLFLLCNCIASLLRTFIAGSDWIVGVVANDRRYENLLATADEEIGKRSNKEEPTIGQSFNGKAEVEAKPADLINKDVVRQLRDQRTKRMDALVLLVQTEDKENSLTCEFRRASSKEPPPVEPTMPHGRQSQRP